MFQQEMIERLRAAAEHDGRIVAVLMYGSFATGEADLFSDIEFAVFLDDEDFAAFDRQAWLDAISPVAAFFADDFGPETALFSNTVRGEFHFRGDSRALGPLAGLHALAHGFVEPFGEFGLRVSGHEQLTFTYL